MSSEPFSAITTLRYDSLAPFVHRDNAGNPELYRLDAHILRLQRTCQAAGWSFEDCTKWVGGVDRTSRFAAVIKYAISMASYANKSPFVVKETDLEKEENVTALKENLEGVWRVRIDITNQPQVDAFMITVARIPAVKPTDCHSFDPFFPQTLLPPAEVAHVLLPRWKIFIWKKPAHVDFHTKHKTSKRYLYDEARQSLTMGEEIIIQNMEGNVMDASISTPYFWRDDQWVTPAAACGGQAGVSKAYALERGLAVEANISVRDLNLSTPVWLSNGLHGFGWGTIQGWK